jgi:putative transposase
LSGEPVEAVYLKTLSIWSLSQNIEEMLDRLKEIFSETCKKMEAELLEFNGEDDHVHLMVVCPPKISAASLVGTLKGKSSYFLRREFWSHIKSKLWGEHFWSPSYCLVSCGGAPLEIVQEYIKNQREPSKENSINQSLRYTGRKRAKDKYWV